MGNKTKVIIEYPNEVLARFLNSLRKGETLQGNILNHSRAWIIREEEQQLKKDKRKRA